MHMGPSPVYSCVTTITGVKMYKRSQLTARLAVVGAAVLLLAGCASSEQIRSLESQIEILQGAVAEAQQAAEEAAARADTAADQAKAAAERADRIFQTSQRK